MATRGSVSNDCPLSSGSTHWNQFALDECFEAHHALPLRVGGRNLRRRACFVQGAITVKSRLFALTLALLVAGCASATPTASEPRFAPWLGLWEGTWANGPRARLYVERMDSSAATVRYEWDDHVFRDGTIMKAGSVYREVKVTQDGKLEWKVPAGQSGGGNQFSFTLFSDGPYLVGKVSSGRFNSSIQMNRR